MYSYVGALANIVKWLDNLDMAPDLREDVFQECALALLEERLPNDRQLLAIYGTVVNYIELTYFTHATRLTTLPYDNNKFTRIPDDQDSGRDQDPCSLSDDY
jgi:hypothetical protein